MLKLWTIIFKSVLMLSGAYTHLELVRSVYMHGVNVGEHRYAACRRISIIFSSQIHTTGLEASSTITDQLNVDCVSAWADCESCRQRDPGSSQLNSMVMKLQAPGSEYHVVGE
jgi:hypothetical protein